jgi:hypothetical protein
MSLTEQTPHPEALRSESKEVYLASEYPQPTNNDAQQEKPARQDVDVLLDVSELEVDRINLTVSNLRAHVSVLAELASLLSLQVGVDARLGALYLTTAVGLRSRTLFHRESFPFGEVRADASRQPGHEQHDPQP